jgi:hypothetical protein
MYPETAIWTIRTGVSVTMLVFGLHQLVRPSAWLAYEPEIIKKYSPISPESLMRFHALGNILIGIFLVAGNFYPLTAAWVALLWWISILPFAFKVKWDIGLRDLAIAASLFALICLQF